MRFPLLILLLLTSFFLTAQSDSIPQSEVDSLPPIPIVAYWRTGDRYKFKVTKISRKTKNDELVKNDTTVHTSLFEVVDSTATSYKIKYTYGFHQGEATEVMAAITAAVAEKGLSANDVFYTTNELGVFQSIDNMEELEAVMAEVIDGVMNTEELTSLPDSAQIIAKNLMSAMFSPQTLVRKVTEEIRLIHYPYGIEVMETDTFNYRDELPNSITGEPIPFDNVLLIDSVDRSNDFIHLKQYAKVPSEEAKATLVNALKRLNLPLTEADQETLEYVIANDNDYYFYYYPGIPVYVDYFRETHVNTPNESVYATEQVWVEWVELED